MKYLIVFFILISSIVYSATWFVPMDDTQKDHLKAYGVVYSCVENGYRVNWLLNYRGGSFSVEGDDKVESMFASKGVSVKELFQKNLPAFKI